MELNVPQDEISKKESENLYVKFCKKFRKLDFLAFDNPSTSSDLKESIDFLGWDISPLDVVIFSRSALILSLIPLLIISSVYFLLNTFSIVLYAFSIIFPLFLAQIISDKPKREAKFEKLKSLGHAPNILTKMIISLKQNPNLEESLEFTTKHSSGHIAKDMKRGLWECVMGKKESLKRELNRIGEKWGNEIKEIKRSFYLITLSVSEKNEVEREKILDKAIDISLEGFVDKIKEYSNKLTIPTFLLFSFGTVLPLVIISVLPIISFVGEQVGSILQIFLLLIFSLIGIYLFSNRILENRPPSLTAIEIPEGLEGFPKKGNMLLKWKDKTLEVNALLFSLVIFVVISFPSIIFLISRIPGLSFQTNLFNILEGYNTLPMVWGIGASISIYLYGTSWYKKKEREKIEELEDEMIGGTYQLASRLSEGKPLEEAFEFTAESMKESRFGKIIREIVNKMKTRHASAKEIIFGDETGEGVVEDINSKDFTLMIKLLLESTKKGMEGAAKTLFVISEHLESLKKSKKKLKESLRNSLSMMKNTARIFAPVIAGIIISLQQMIQKGISTAKERMADMGEGYLTLSFFNAPDISIEFLQLVIGIYVLLLAIILIRYVVYIEYGDDKIKLKYELSKSLPIALAIFTFTLVMSRIMML